VESFNCYHFNGHAQAGLLTLLLAFLGASTAFAQPMGGEDDADEGIYAVPIGNPTIVWSAPSTNSRELARLDSAGVALKTVGKDTTNAQGELFERIRPRAGSGLSWESGYVLASQIQVGIDRPTQYSVGVYGTLALSSTEPSTFSLDGFDGTAQNPFGEEGRSPILGAGATFKTGKYIPPGDAGPWFRFDIEYAALPHNEDAARNVDSTTANWLRAAAGGEYIYQASPSVDLYVGALIGGASVGNELTLDNGQTITTNGVFGMADVLVGVGYGRNTSARAGAFGGFGVRLEGGYRFGQRFGDWSFSVDDEDVDGSLEAEDADEALSVSGPVLRLILGF
jgi:hypothetical protein